MADITSANKTINRLKQDMRHAQKDEDLDDVKDCRRRIKGYTQLRRDMEAELFATRNKA